MTQEIIQAFGKEDYPRTIELLTDFMKNNLGNSTAHAMLGLAYFLINDFTNSRIEFKVAIEKGHVSRRVYVAYADTLCLLNNLDEALIYYEKAIAVDNNLKENNIFRKENILFKKGNINLHCENLEAGLKDFLALSDYVNHNNIEFDKISSVNLYIGDLYAGKQDYANALAYLLKSKNNKFLVFLANEVAKLNVEQDEKEFLFFRAFALSLPIDLIRFESLNKAKNNDISFCHYTSLEVVDKLILKNDDGIDNTMRYYNAIHMADPEEGNTIFELLGENAKFLFEKGKDNEENNVYLGSFMESKDCDKHIMWRTYGKGKGEEAKGCSIVIKNDFFDGMYGSFNKYLTDVTKIKEDTNNCLNKVYYYNYEEKDIVNDDNSCIKNNLDAAIFLIEDLYQFYSTSSKSDIKKCIESIVNRAISEIQYLFKSHHWDYEKEYRIIQVIPHHNPEVLVDKFSSPKKLYINSPKIVKEHLEKVILGAKVKNPAEWISLDAQLKKENKEVEFSFSKCKFQ